MNDPEFYYWNTMHRVYRAVKNKWDGASPEVILAQFRREVRKMRLVVPALEAEQEAA